MKNEPEDASILRPHEMWDRANGPIHSFFGLTYSSYFVLPRIALSSMPVDWQKRFVELMDEARFRLPDDIEPPGGYAVFARNDHGRFERDPLSQYRHEPLLPISEGPLLDRDEIFGDVIPPRSQTPKARDSAESPKRSIWWRIWNALPSPPHETGFR